LAVEEREVTALRRLGLTEYEARTYLVLAKMGPIRASEVSFFGQIPRTKTYGAIKELQHKGLVNLIPGKPELYSARSPSEVFMPLVAKFDSDVRDSEAVVQSLAVAFESSKFVKSQLPKPAGDFWVIEGRQNIFSKLNNMFQDASKSVIYCTSAAGLIRAYKAHSEILERARGNGASVRFLSSISPENSSVAQEMAAVIEIRITSKPFGATFAATDTRELLIVDTRPDDLRIDRGSDSAVWTTNKPLVELVEQLFGMMWAASTPPHFSAPDN
jgi:sugar-specific transcriptional regulator TrmB